MKVSSDLRTHKTYVEVSIFNKSEFNLVLVIPILQKCFVKVVVHESRIICIIYYVVISGWFKAQGWSKGPGSSWFWYRFDRVLSECGVGYSVSTSSKVVQCDICRNGTLFTVLSQHFVPFS